MTVRIVLQARTTSTRLPAKVLLPVGGLPLAVLCARRLGRGGLPLVLATSSDPSDDELVDTVAGAGVAVVRGPLDDVFARFALASKDLGDDDVLIRATADNPVPDHELVSEMLADFQATGVDYLGMRSYRDVPYGAAVEVIRLGALRAVAATVDAHAREHVTSGLAARPPADVPNPGRLDVGLGPVRVTVDTLEDYLVAARAFRGEAGAVAMPWRDAVRRMDAVRTRAE